MCLRPLWHVRGVIYDHWRIPILLWSRNSHASAWRNTEAVSISRLCHEGDEHSSRLRSSGLLSVICFGDRRVFCSHGNAKPTLTQRGAGAGADRCDESQIFGYRTASSES